MQPLLVPIAMAVGQREAEIVETFADELMQLGLDLRCSSDESIMVRSIPVILKS